MHFYKALQLLVQFFFLSQDTYTKNNDRLLRRLGCSIENCIICNESNDQVCDKCNTTYVSDNGLCKYNEKNSSDEGFFSDKSYLIFIIVFGAVTVLGIILCLTL